jgi:hypothetical protein
MKRPTFFLSSTIYDFSDLRSAVKHLLEQQGCIVLASEYNDFNKPLDVHSYQGCLDSIAQADFFILFIGTRTGGWFDKDNRISITQREYREAYDLHKQGRIKLLNFVRGEIWQLKEDRNALTRYLETLNLGEETKNKITNYPTKNVVDAKFIIDFINEVGRNKETKQALAQGKPFPTGNWLHVFHTFKDIVDVLQTHVFSGQPLEEAAMRRLLHRELMEILRICLIKYKNTGIYSPRPTIELFHKEHKLTLDTKEEEYITVNIKRWNLISALSIHLLGMTLHPRIISQALSSMVFLSFDSVSGVCKEEPVYEALYLLQEEIKRFQRANTKDVLKVIFDNSAMHREPGLKAIDIEPIKLVGLLHVFDRWINIIELSKSIIKYLDGGTFSIPRLRERSPIPDMNAELQAETVTVDEVQSFIKEGY